MARPGSRGPVPRSISERVAGRFDVTATGCHEWTGAIDSRGRPSMQSGSAADGSRRPRRVHRLLWEETHGPLADGIDLHHVCENKLCVNLGHLVPLTHGEHARISALARWTSA